MIREINILDAKDIQEICKDELGYNVDIKTVKKQIEKLSIDYKHHIIAVYEDKKTTRHCLNCSEMPLFDAFDS